MKSLLVSPLPRWYLLTCKLLAGVAVSILQVYMFLVIAAFWEIWVPPLGYVAILPALILSGLMVGSLGMLLSSMIKQLENFAGVMNFVIFPMFFASSTLYPLWKIKDSSLVLYYICAYNPFTHAVEMIRFSLYGQVNAYSILYVLVSLALFLGIAIYGYDPSRGFVSRKGGPVA
jgi:ABC-2 type transport system permease protein